MRNINELTLSEQFSLWRRWDFLARKHFGNSRRPKPTNVEFDGVSAGAGLAGLWLWGGWVLAYCAFYAELVNPFVVWAYFSGGWLVVVVLALLLLVLFADPTGKHTVRQAAVINRYNFAMSDLALELNVDLSRYCYSEYGDAIIHIVRPTRPPTPKPIPSRPASRIQCGTDDQSIVEREHNGLPGNLLTPARLRRVIEAQVLEKMYCLEKKIQGTDNDSPKQLPHSS